MTDTYVCDLHLTITKTKKSITLDLRNCTDESVINDIRYPELFVQIVVGLVRHGKNFAIASYSDEIFLDYLKPEERPHCIAGKAAIQKYLEVLFKEYPEVLEKIHIEAFFDRNAKSKHLDNICQHFQVDASELIFFDDDINNVLHALLAGIRSVWVYADTVWLNVLELANAHATDNNLRQLIFQKYFNLDEDRLILLLTNYIQTNSQHPLFNEILQAECRFNLTVASRVLQWLLGLARYNWKNVDLILAKILSSQKFHDGIFHEGYRISFTLTKDVEQIGIPKKSGRRTVLDIAIQMAAKNFNEVNCKLLNLLLESYCHSQAFSDIDKNSAIVMVAAAEDSRVFDIVSDFLGNNINYRAVTKISVMFKGNEKLLAKLSTLGGFKIFMAQLDDEELMAELHKIPEIRNLNIQNPYQGVQCKLSSSENKL